MTVRIYSNPDDASAPKLQTTTDVVNADANKVGPKSASMERQHRAGNTVDRGNHVSSVWLLGLSLVGASVVLVVYWLIS